MNTKDKYIKKLEEFNTQLVIVFRNLSKTVNDLANREPPKIKWIDNYESEISDLKKQIEQEQKEVSAEDFFEQISPNDNFGVREKLKRVGLFHIVCSVMERYASQFSSEQVTDEEIKEWAEHTPTVRICKDWTLSDDYKYREGLYDGAKAHRDGKIIKKDTGFVFGTKSI